MESISMNVTGMHCRSCAMRIQLEVEDLPGIASVVALPDADRVDVEYDPTAVSPEQIATAIGSAGFTVAP